MVKVVQVGGFARVVDKDDAAEGVHVEEVEQVGDDVLLVDSADRSPTTRFEPTSMERLPLKLFSLWFPTMVIFSPLESELARFSVECMAMRLLDIAFLVTASRCPIFSAWYSAYANAHA